MINHILEADPGASPDDAGPIAEVWEEVVSSILDEMLVYSRPHTNELHIDLHEEMAFELATLQLWLARKVATDRMNGRVVKDIDPRAEREECFSTNGRERISTTARNCAEKIWLKRCKERWRPKTEAALRKEKDRKHTRVVPKPVEDNHFIPKSFLKRYWAENAFVFKNVKRPYGLDEKRRTPVGNWGFRTNLYSDYLEAYFGPVEGDAVRPIQMVLDVVPLNRPQREAMVGFIVIQRLRNPYFMALLSRAISPVVASEVCAEKAEDEQYMQKVYETIYSQHDFYDKIARPILHSQWVVVRSETPDFVLPDVCNVFGSHEGKQYVMMPLTPKDCLVVLPIEVDEPRIVPHNLRASGSIVADMAHVLRCASKREFLSSSEASFHTVHDDPNEVALRVIVSLSRFATSD